MTPLIVITLEALTDDSHRIIKTDIAKNRCLAAVTIRNP